MTCDQATFMLERRWDRTLTGDEERALDEHIRACEVCRLEAEAITLADTCFLNIPDLEPPVNLAAAVAQQIAQEAPVERTRGWFWGAVFALGAIVALLLHYGVPLPAEVLSSPYYTGTHTFLVTLSGVLGSWLRPVFTIAKTLMPAASAVGPLLGASFVLELGLLGLWLIKRGGRRHTAEQA